MKIFVKARPGAREESVEKIDENHFVISVKEPPVRGMANNAIIRALADYFNVPVASVKMISGYSSRQKMFEIITD